MTSLRVAIVMPHSLEGTPSGDRARTRVLAAGLRARGLSVLVLAPSWRVKQGEVLEDEVNGQLLVGQARRGLPKLIWRSALAIRRRFDRRALHHMPGVRKSLERELRSRHFDVVDVQHTYWSLRVDAPLVATAIDVQANSRLVGSVASESFHSLVRRVFERSAIRRAAVVVVLSDEEAQRCVSAYPWAAGRLRTVPVGHPAVVPSAEVSSDGLQPPGKKIALFVGSMDYPPNASAARALIAAWSVHEGESDLPDLVIAGRGADRLRGLALPLNVAIYSDVPDLVEFYRRSAMAVMPIMVGGGVRLKALEAMAYQVPILATKLAVDGLGLAPDESYIRIGDLDELIRAAKTLGSDELATIAARAYDRWLEIGHPDRMIDRMLQVYEEVAGSAVRRSTP